MNERLKQVRTNLQLSQEAVADQLGIARTAMAAIESGKRQVTTDELVKLCEIYGVTADELLYGDVSEENEEKTFARAFAKLSDEDKKEVLDLINAKLGQK